MKYSLLAIAFILLLPDLAQGQGLTEALCDGTTCSACHFAVLGNRLINWLIGMVILLFAVLAVWAGFGLVTSGGNPSALQDAKSRFTNAFIGFLIVLSAWLLVDTLMRGIVRGTDGEIEGYGPWSQIQCASQSEATTEPDSLTIETASSFVTSAAETCDSTPDGARVLCDRLIEACAADGSNPIVDTSNSRNHTVSCDRPVGVRDASTQTVPCDVGPSGGRTQCSAQVAQCEATPGSTAQIVTSDPESYEVACFAASPTSACNESEMSTVRLFGFNPLVANTIVPRLQAINAEWERRGGNSFYRVYSVGAYNCRPVTNGSNYSVHAYALAVDVNPRDNGYVRPRPAGGCPTDMTQSGFQTLFTSRGFGWGGNWRSACDAMHFSAEDDEGGWISLD